jgi:hypothetical protein
MRLQLPPVEQSRRDLWRARWLPWGAGRSSPQEPRMTPTREQRLEHFNTEIFGHVEGWLGDRMSQVVGVLGALLDANGVRGNIVEFGVHHGLFLFLLNVLRNDNEECFAIDVFDRQHLNVDHSGSGSLAMFQAHLDTLMGPQRQFFRIVQRDTLSFSTVEVTDLFGKIGVKALSIDAGHTVHHACNDLHLAQEVLVPGGIVALDDYMSVHWPGVTEGFYRFMNTENRRLKPFLVFQNKLFLTTVSEHASCLRQFRTAIEAICGDEVRAGRWKEVEIAGSHCVAFA